MLDNRGFDETLVRVKIVNKDPFDARRCLLFDHVSLRKG